MDEREIAAYRSGYDECRQIMIGDLRKISKLKCRQRDALNELLAGLVRDAEEDHWRCVQEEFPGITREEYEQSMNETVQAIHEKYYNKDGRLKLRLIRPSSQSSS